MRDLLRRGRVVSAEHLVRLRARLAASRADGAAAGTRDRAGDGSDARAGA